MADITMCSGKGCNLALRCYRHTAKANRNMQSYFLTAPLNEDGSCNHYWNKSGN